MSFPFSVDFFAAEVADLTLILPGLDDDADGAFGLPPNGFPNSIFNEETCFLATVGNAENAETWAIKIKAIQIDKYSIVPNDLYENLVVECIGMT